MKRRLRGVVVLSITVAVSGLAGCTEGGGVTPALSPSPGPSAATDPDADLARLLGMDAHAIGTKLPGYSADMFGGMKLEDGVYVTGEFSYTLAVPEATVTVYLGDPWNCVEASAVGPSGTIVYSSLDNATYGSSSMPDFGEPCDEKYDEVEPREWAWENPIGLEGWEWLVGIPGTCLVYFASELGPIDERLILPRVVSCDGDWTAILLSKGFLDAGEDPTDDGLWAIASAYCENDFELYGGSIERIEDLEMYVQYPTTWGYETGDTTYSCTMERPEQT